MNSTAKLQFSAAEPLLGKLDVWDPPSALSSKNSNSFSLDSISNALMMKVSASAMISSFKLATGTTETIGSIITSPSSGTQGYSWANKNLGNNMDLYL